MNIKKSENLKSLKSEDLEQVAGGKFSRRGVVAALASLSSIFGGMLGQSVLATGSDIVPAVSLSPSSVNQKLNVSEDTSKILTLEEFKVLSKDEKIRSLASITRKFVSKINKISVSEENSADFEHKKNVVRENFQMLPYILTVSLAEVMEERMETYSELVENLQKKSPDELTDSEKLNIEKYEKIEEAIDKSGSGIYTVLVDILEKESLDSEKNEESTNFFVDFIEMLLEDEELVQLYETFLDLTLKFKEYQKSGYQSKEILKHENKTMDEFKALSKKEKVLSIVDSVYSDVEKLGDTFAGNMQKYFQRWNTQEDEFRMVLNVASAIVKGDRLADERLNEKLGDYIILHETSTDEELCQMYENILKS